MKTRICLIATAITGFVSIVCMVFTFVFRGNLNIYMDSDPILMVVYPILSYSGVILALLTFILLLVSGVLGIISLTKSHKFKTKDSNFNDK